jgi:hypothetical protein
MGTGAIIRDAMLKGMPGNEALIPPSTFLGILPPEMWNKPKRLFAVPFTILALLQNTTRTAQFQADVDNDYVFYYGAATTRSADNLTVISPAALLIDLSTTGNQQSYNPPNQGNDIDNVLGTARQPSVWAMPLILPAGQTLIMTVTALGLSATLNFRATLMGFRVARVLR